jgi:electron transport complex protein RnfD
MSTLSTPIVLVQPGASPVRNGLETPRIMASVAVALLPATACGCFLFGARAALTLGTCVVACMAFEAILCSLLQRKWTLGDFSALVTGMLLALTLPPATPVLVCIAASFAAIAIAKYAFGGLGANVFNPVLVGRVLCTAAFPTALSTFSAPVRTFLPVDSVTSATPLALLKYQGIATYAALFGDPLHRYLHLLLGNHGGSLGETSVFALWIGGLFLMARRVISWRVPLAMYGAAAVIAVLAWPITGDPLSHLLSGGLALGALFMATDYVTSPSYPAGKLIFGAGCGCLTMLIRICGVYAEGCMYAILTMNLLVPLIDRITTPQPFGAPGQRISLLQRVKEALTALGGLWVAGFTFARAPQANTQSAATNEAIKQRPLVLQPVVMIGLGLAPLLAVATDLRAAVALAMGLLIVQVLTLVVLLIVRPWIARPLAPLFVVIAAAAWTLALRMLAHAYFPDLAIRDTLSCWLLPALLPTVNLAWLLFDDEAKKYAGYRVWMLSNVGLGVVLCLLAAIRELLGAGSLWKIAVASKPLLSWALTTSGGCAIAALLLLVLALLFGGRWAEGKE